MYRAKLERQGAGSRREDEARGCRLESKRGIDEEVVEEAEEQRLRETVSQVSEPKQRQLFQSHYLVGSAVGS